LHRKIIIASVVLALCAGIVAVLRFEGFALAGFLLLGLVPVVPDSDAAYYFLVAIVAVAFLIFGVFAWRRRSTVLAGIFCAVLLASVSVGFIRAERISAEIARTLANGLFEGLSRGGARK
jgi:hypothetical protein